MAIAARSWDTFYFFFESIGRILEQSKRIISVLHRTSTMGIVYHRLGMKGAVVFSVEIFYRRDVFRRLRGAIIVEYRVDQL